MLEAVRVGPSVGREQVFTGELVVRRLGRCDAVAVRGVTAEEHEAGRRRQQRGRRQDATRTATITDASGRMAVDGTARAQFEQQLAAAADHAKNKVVVAHSARNKLSSLISKVTRGTVMDQMEIRASSCPLLSREAADELGLKSGMLAVTAATHQRLRQDPPQYPGA